MKKIICLIILLLSLSSCIEILDDIKINSDGTGTFKYTINLSSSKLKVNSILALDSIDGFRVVKKPELISKIEVFGEHLKQQPGISNVIITYDFENYIFKLSCDFDNVTNLESGIKNSVEASLNNNLENYHNFISVNQTSILRNTPQFIQDRFVNSHYLNEELLKTGSYTTITRLDRPVISNSNLLAKVSKSGQSVMIRVAADEILKNIKILDNKISF